MLPSSWGDRHLAGTLLLPLSLPRGRWLGWGTVYGCVCPLRKKISLHSWLFNILIIMLALLSFVSVFPAMRPCSWEPPSPSSVRRRRHTPSRVALPTLRFTRAALPLCPNPAVADSCTLQRPWKPPHATPRACRQNCLEPTQRGLGPRWWMASHVGLCPLQTG